MFERYTDRARAVMQLACQEAQRYNHAEIDLHHVLIAIMKEGSGVGAEALKEIGLDLRTIRLAVEDAFPVGQSGVDGKLQQSLRCTEALFVARRISEDCKLHYVGTEHILLGLIRRSKYEPAHHAIVEKLGLDYDAVVTAIGNVLPRRQIGVIEIMHDAGQVSCSHCNRPFALSPEQAVELAHVLGAMAGEIVKAFEPVFGVVRKFMAENPRSKDETDDAYIERLVVMMGAAPVIAKKAKE